MLKAYFGRGRESMTFAAFGAILAVSTNKLSHVIGNLLLTRYWMGFVGLLDPRYSFFASLGIWPCWRRLTAPLW
jgi:hypothetical protein